MADVAKFDKYGLTCVPTVRLRMRRVQGRRDGILEQLWISTETGEQIWRPITVVDHEGNPE